MKIGCIIQGDIRRGSEIVLQELPKHFDFAVLSTWKSDKNKVPSGDFSVILNDNPAKAGLSHRNYQRFSTARGIDATKSAGCNYVLKWRSDMLPTNLDIHQLKRWADFDVPTGMKSRIVMPSFRNLTVEPDWFSSIPDLFSFGHIDMMEMLWGDKGFDYNEKINIPEMMRRDIMCGSIRTKDFAELYCAESELYALFKERMQIKLNTQLSHYDLCKSYFRLFDEKKLKIFWFGGQTGFRCIRKAWEHPWWTEKTWRQGKPEKVPCGYPVTGLIKKIKAALSPFRTRIDEFRQSLMWLLFRLKRLLQNK